jgi:pyruvate formate lyase activating enzyme
MDAANVDLKAFSDDLYRRVCGGDLQTVLDTLVYLKRETSVWLEVTTLLIPGENDSDAELHAAGRWMIEQLGPDVPWHFTAFHPDYRMRDRPHTPAHTLARARGIAREYGLRHVYTGNVQDLAGNSTYCAKCQALLIGRDRYVLSSWNLDAAGRCRACGTPCPGVFDAQPGHWGARRLPVRIGGVP